MIVHGLHGNQGKQAAARLCCMVLHQGPFAEHGLHGHSEVRALGLRAREERHHLLRRCDCEDRSEIKTALAPVFALLVV